MSDPDSPMNHDPIPDPSPVRNQSSPPLALLPPPLSSSAPDDASAEPASVTDLKSASIPAVASKSSVPVARFISSWVHFKRMEAMENRPETKQGNESGDADNDDGNYTARYQFSGGSFKNGGGEGSVARTTPRFFNRNGTAGSGGGGGGGSSSSGGIRIRIPTGVSIAQPGPRFPGKIDQKYTASPSSGMSSNPRSGRGLGAGGYSARVLRIPEGGGKRGREMMMKTEEDDDNDNDPMVEIASAIKLLGDTLLRTEQTRMEMTREIEAMRMDTEMKRTKMILESQQRIVEAFAKTIADNTEEKKKKARRMSSLAADS